uniref:Ectonucleotide pyrophosphatase/phosphodiesterase 7 n=1 Tax=Coturnix japonica TaxID=93934 RepID=A0A8C2UEK4_COTJA
MLTLLKGEKMFCSLVLLLAALPAAKGSPVPLTSSRDKVLLVSFDGFRWDYDQDVDTPNLDLMAVEGVKAQYMTPAFITLTSPCHFTLLTGECHQPAGVQNGKGQMRGCISY